MLRDVSSCSNWISQERSLTSIKPLVNRILDGRGITQVVVVDNAVGEPHWYALIEQFGRGDRAELGQEFGIDLLATNWREQLDNTDVDTNRSIAAEVNSLFTSLGLPRPAPPPRDATLLRLQNILSKYTPMQLTSDQWLARKDQLFEMALSAPTLFLIDQRLENGREGGNFLKELPFEELDQCFFCLFTADTSVDDEFNYWRDKCQEYTFTQGEVGIIAKAHLDSEDQIGFVRMLKLSLTVREVDGIRDDIISAAHEGLNSTTDRFRALDIPALTSMVFESSHVEGIWQIETLLRIVKAFYDQALDNKVYNDTKIAAATEHIAAAASVSTGRDERLSKATFVIQHAERYITNDYLSEQRIALSNGDLFEVTDGNHSGTLWVLLTQSCDLAIRPDGKRNGSPTHLTLLEVERLDKASRMYHMALSDLFPPGEPQAFVRLSKPSYVPTAILDLAAFSPSGEANWSKESDPEEILVAGWRKRFEQLSCSFRQAFDKYGHLNEDFRRNYIELTLPGAEEPDIFPRVIGVTVRYPIKRIGRLRERQAEAVLQAFGLTISRAAEAHDLAEIGS